MYEKLTKIEEGIIGYNDRLYFYAPEDVLKAPKGTLIESIKMLDMGFNCKNYLLYKVDGVVVYEPVFELVDRLEYPRRIKSGEIIFYFDEKKVDMRSDEVKNIYNMIMVSKGMVRVPLEYRDGLFLLDNELMALHYEDLFVPL